MGEMKKKTSFRPFISQRLLRRLSCSRSQYLGIVTSSFPASQASCRVSFPPCCPYAEVARVLLTLISPICAWKGKTYRHICFHQTSVFTVSYVCFLGNPKLVETTVLQNQISLDQSLLTQKCLIFLRFDVKIVLIYIILFKSLISTIKKTNNSYNLQCSFLFRFSFRLPGESETKEFIPLPISGSFTDHVKMGNCPNIKIEIVLQILMSLQKTALLKHCHIQCLYWTYLRDVAFQQETQSPLISLGKSWQSIFVC